MAVVRLEAFRALRAAVVDALAGTPLDEKHVFLGQQTYNQKACYPALVIEPVRLRYQPEQEQERFEPDATHLVTSVGTYVATVQLKLGAAQEFQRWDLQERVSRVFLETEGHAGILLTTVVSAPEYGRFLSAWSLEEDEWQDERVFDNQFWSTMTIEGQIPALVTRAGISKIETLAVGMTSDFSIVPSPFVSGAGVEVVDVRQDGTLVKV